MQTATNDPKRPGSCVFRIVPLAPAHLDEAVALHRRAFANYFLSLMGPRFLKLLYSAYISDPTAVSLVALSEKNTVLGAVLGSTEPSQFYRRLFYSKGWKFGLAALPHLVKKPSIIARLARGLVYRGEAPSGPPRALLASICVETGLQGAGIGRALVKDWLVAVQRKGAHGTYLSTDITANPANQFYQSLGFEVESIYEPTHGRRMNRYVLDWEPSAVALDTASVIAIVTSEFPPEPTVMGRMAYDLAKGLVDKGHRVTVIAPYPSRPISKTYSESEIQDATVELKGRVKLVRLDSFTHPRSTVIGRGVESLSFGRAAARWLRHNHQGINLVYDMSWPMLGQHCVSRAAGKLKIPLVMSVMDVYPECLLKRLPDWLSRVVGQPLMAWDKAIVHRADRIVVISQEMKQLYQQSRNVPEARIEVVRTWQDESIYLPRPQRQEAAAKYEVDYRIFTFMYLGNIGPVAGVEHLIRSFHRADISNAHLLIVGDGSQRAFCMELGKQLNPRNIHFLSEPDSRRVPLLQSLADVFLLPMKKGAAGSSVPSKLGAYMLSAKPIIATVDPDSATARAIFEAQCGWVGAPEDEAWLAGQMQKVVNIPATELEELGRHAYRYGAAHFSKTSGVQKLFEIFGKTLQARDALAPAWEGRR